MVEILSELRATDQVERRRRMTNEEKIVNRITGVLKASEDTIRDLSDFRDKRFCELIAKEMAYEHIKGIIEDVGYNPYQE